ncbi:MAG: hypothetical protein A2233_04660 [Candidatus Kerfeldbacteria bacterium RIFOXYA2_FULL_38_24]|uniref:S-adenosyl-l-methionine hydroxide adenosyltransferase C-terminal domain-containing protein n=1 Tax=Candidatus Kerfeldbacteria bacterium RIFOXYB2_FULL_38_14 TaxID=1798547 RepID=A0A1G2BFX7_9BACT|nr:MAG: hypothetical protein A2319_02420 [Candidatus Kerfeldbacteria bacterium RIFOXYB2_FULL_38_14]OGY88163.1 MAG: hypothetical protein A2233_04660 [Candidatus Kerfeldbacteria bacterium RIFOXYA2_FULL_38_24]OGY89183.1 MAG: hypothetical protein A2458_01135 [Candidatus Kerfeldbacteria bacterium RIFOXYC2_FULL_38_9]
MNQEYLHPITYITDCRDDNTLGRLRTRVSTLFSGSSVVFVRVSSNLSSADVEAAINLVDIIDAYDGHPGIILVNVAPRNGNAKRWPNGTPFGWLQLGNLAIFTTIDGYTLSLIQKVLKQQLTVKIYDIPTCVPKMDLSAETQKRIINTQFRSFDYLPRLAAEIVHGRPLPITETFSEIPIMPLSTCWIDSFGNIKTNILPEEIDFKVGEDRVLRVGENKQFRLPCYERLKDIPDNVAALTVGSSGLGDKRFIEIMKQGKSAACELGLTTGEQLRYIK